VTFVSFFGWERTDGPPDSGAQFALDDE